MFYCLSMSVQNAKTKCYNGYKPNDGMKSAMRCELLLNRLYIINTLLGQGETQTLAATKVLYLVVRLNVGSLLCDTSHIVYTLGKQTHMSTYAKTITAC